MNETTPTVAGEELARIAWESWTGHLWEGATAEEQDVCRVTTARLERAVCRVVAAAVEAAVAARYAPLLAVMAQTIDTAYLAQGALRYVVQAPPWEEMCRRFYALATPAGEPS